MCEVLLTLPSFSSDMAYILSWEPHCYCQSVNVGGWLPISQWLRQRMDAIIRELCPISCPGNVSGRVFCWSTGQNKCWVIHWCQYKVEGDNLWWCLKDSWKRLIIAVKLNAQCVYTCKIRMSFWEAHIQETSISIPNPIISKYLGIKWKLHKYSVRTQLHWELPLDITSNMESVRSPLKAHWNLQVRWSQKTKATMSFWIWPTCPLL